MSFVNIVSAIGNNSKIYPLLVRDCGIEIPSKISLTYNQNLKDSKEMAYNATREGLINEYGTSFIWIGGPIAADKFSDWGIKKLGFDPNVNADLFQEGKKQGLKYNIEKFKDKAPNVVASMEKVLKNQTKYQKLLAGKFLLSTVIPVSIMGYFLPKANFKLTEKLKERQIANKKKQELLCGETSFKGMTATLANMSTVNKMAVTDGGLTVGRVYTGRNKYERLEQGFRNIAMMFLNFVFPIYLAKGLDKTSAKLFKTNVNLDPKLFDDKEFLKSIKENNLELPQKGEIIEFLDNKPDSKFSKICEEYCGIKRLPSGIRDPRAFVNEKKIEAFQAEIEKFAREAKQSGNIDKYAKKALKVKSANIFANVGISSFMLAVALPKLIFFLRKKVTGSDAEPGLIDTKKAA